MKQKQFSRILVIVGSRLAELREKKGFSTVKDFAIAHNLPEVHYWRIEKGKANITLKSLVKILAIHKVTLHEFFCALVSDSTMI